MKTTKQSNLKKLSIFLILILILNFVNSQDIYPTTIGEITTKITLGGNGTIENLTEGEEVKFQTLTFQDTDYQKIEEIKEELIINNKKILPDYSYDEFGNKYVNFSITQNGAFNYQIEAIITRNSKIYEIKDFNITNPEKKLLEYTKKSEKIESDSIEIITLTNNKLTKKSFLETLNKTIFWTNDYIEYAKGEDFKKYYLLQKSAIETLIDKKGVCDEYANLSAAMLRSKNIPTKIVMGITFDGIEWGNHAWIETYHNELGWIPSDPTFRESGFVDATHIKIGSFKDITQSLAKATYPKKTNVTFQTQTLPQVEIINTKYFNQVSLYSKTEEIKTNQWNDFIIEATNKTNQTITIPITIKETYQELIIQEKSKTITLGPKAKTNISFKIYPLIKLEENEIAKGTLTFNTLSEPFKKEINIKPGSIIENGKIIVNDVTPIANPKDIIFDISVTNFTTKNSIIDINIKNEENEKHWAEQIDPLTKQNYRKIITNNEKNQLITIETPTERYEQLIYPLQEKIEIIEEQEEQTIVTQKIKEKKEQNIVKELTERPEIILFALLPAVAVIIFGLFLTKKQYI